MIAPDAMTVLVENQRRFLAFLTPRLGGQEAARELLQAAMVKALERGGSIKDGESAVAWFYRLLRNALIDRAREGAVERRALEKQAAEALLAEDEDRELARHVCSCVEGLTDAVKPEYAQVVRAVDLQGQEVVAFAKESGLTAGNARVRLHRARAALGKRLLDMCGTCCAQGCENCPCEAPSPKSEGPRGPV